MLQWSSRTRTPTSQSSHRGSHQRSRCHHSCIHTRIPLGFVTATPDFIIIWPLTFCLPLLLPVLRGSSRGSENRWVVQTISVPVTATAKPIEGITVFRVWFRSSCFVRLLSFLRSGWLSLSLGKSAREGFSASPCISSSLALRIIPLLPVCVIVGGYYPNWVLVVVD